MAVASAGFTLPGYLAEALTLSPTVTQGPYYPLGSNIPLDKDNDLVRLDDRLTDASGTIIHIQGQVLDASGSPIRGALVELWHADHEGDYLYSASAARNPACDPNFAGFGQFLTGSNGAFRFRTLKAGLYVGRTRHLHWGVTLPGERARTTTQTGWNETALDLSGQPWATQNSNDNVFASVQDPLQRASMLLDFAAEPGSTLPELFAHWDYVAGRTYTEPVYPGGGTLRAAGVPVEVAPESRPRFKVTIPAYAGYSYEIYANPTLGPLSWKALPFALTATASPDRNIYTAATDGTLDLYVDQSAERGLYLVSFRVPGANTGTPGSGGGSGGPGGRP